MKRPSWKVLIPLSVVLALVVGGGSLWLQDTSAAAAVSLRPALNTVARCPVLRDPVIAINGADVATRSTGTIQVLAGKTYTGTDGREVTDLTVQNTLTEGTAEGVGSLVISNDTSRPAPSSSLAANAAGASFPATSVIRFYPSITINGETFRLPTSAGPATLVNTAVNEYPAKAGTVYVLTNSLSLRSNAGNSITVKPGRAVTIQ